MTKGFVVNRIRPLLTGAAAVAAAVAIGACGNSATENAASSPAPSSAPSSTTAASSAAHNQADVMFAQHMIPHHQQAVQMSDVILGKQGIDPRVVDLAKQIKAAQGPEIEQMQGWLNQWGVPAMSGMPGMGDHGGMPGMGGMGDMGDMPGMDGMMSAADMQALQNAQGVAASKLFLTQMIEHHQGAITMAQNEIKNGQSQEAVTLAKSIASSQQQEIDTMNQILGTL
ncbi:DUF305 domain-containing protein [Mycobacterium sp. CVI_P3]|uniref:DUF305 domain-containing protein n=1 Tax=Mycobacterium pinniadriaticum TaxID=2994102 RepID=A0ABT3S7R5_9MYCO|nr:DUF305 domain-containing protein [Mycobacterium pinniadriaticum]MCX2929097.1 DUF305 domain-containing protein [Mycobacterium pinniadriaticum]MCX2935522.1 DUF305 domain-containing protein [Mycobacterium pinniadriaticum]